jgi:hypothetical protein
MHAFERRHQRLCIGHSLGQIRNGVSHRAKKFSHEDSTFSPSTIATVQKITFYPIFGLEKL